jgi:copper homeostasis protein
MILEIACFNLQSAIIAAQAGADRIELCSTYSVGGITPSKEIIKQAREKISIPIYVMIRPCAGNFIYTDEEFEKMKSEILFCKQNNIEGIVFGILNEDKTVDVNRCKELVELAKPMQATFHRAFDEIENSFEALEQIIDCGFTRILTSGKKKTAIEGAELISQLIQKANGRITILAGGGVRAENIVELKNKTGTTEFHSAAILGQSFTADENEIRKIKSILSV